jgi:ectoine hydroxylase-related dioxygenase (phytanoyl-CoA dioxygenase family)
MVIERFWNNGARLMQPTIKLTDEQIAFYHREGYLAIAAITTPEEVAWLREIYDRLFAQQAGRDEGNQFDLAGADEDGVAASLPQILRPDKYAPELLRSLCRMNALAMAKQLLGAEAEYHGEHAILKPALHGAETPWHQDEAYWEPDLEYNELSVWIPLQEANLENGCMHFIPGSHKLEVMPHHTINHDPRIHGLEIDRIDAAKAVACPLPPGGATFHGPRTLHYTPPNRSAIPRRAYILGFGTSAKKCTTPRDFYWNRMKKTAREERMINAQEKGLNG